MNLWRINIKTKAVGVDPRMFCFDNSILGIGWRVSDQQEVLSWDQYVEKGRVRYESKRGWRPAVDAIHHRMKENDLCWSRDASGVYYLGRISGGWQYCSSAKHLQADVLNIRPCQWVRIGTVDAVPGRVVNSFVPSRTVQRVNGNGVKEYSKYLFNMGVGVAHFTVDLGSYRLLDLFQPEDFEDVVAIYLQELGYSLIPSTCKKSTMSYEFVLKHNLTGEKAVVQVKSGKQDLIRDEYAKYDKAYLFTLKGDYLGEPLEQVQCLEAHVLESFVRNHKERMPDRIQHWLDAIDELRRPKEV